MGYMPQNVSVAARVHAPSFAARLVAAAVVITGVVFLSGCQESSQETPGGTEVEDVHLDTFRDAGDELEYKEVSVQGQVAQNISPSAFSISDPDDPGVDELFILDKSGTAAVEPGMKVNVRGIVYIGFDVSEIKQSHGVELDPALEQEWEGQTYIVASNVDAQK